MCRSQAQGGRRCTGHHPAPSPAAAGPAAKPRPQHVYCTCVGWHKQGCANYGVPDAMPAFIPDKTDPEYGEYMRGRRS